MTRTLLVIAGEDSGDLHGAELLRELKLREPGLRIIGVGGPRMTPFLDRKLADVKDLAVVGFIEVIRHLPRLNRLFKEILAAAREESVSAALLIDYPGFNLRLAKALRRQQPGVKLHQYVCPQVWAWKKGRIPDLGTTLDTLYCLFDFEPELFRGYPVDARFVGHPLVEVVKPECDRGTFFGETGLDRARPLVALLPGSRTGEIQRLLPPMAELARRWRQERPEVQWVLPVAPTLDPTFVRAHLGGAPVTLVQDRTYAARAYADAALVASGTATLETALLGTPFAIVYRLNALTYQIARHIVKVPHFGLANVVAGREVAVELLQDEVNPERLGVELTRLLEPETARRVRAELGDVRGHLGEPGAAGRVAEDLLGKL
ncbi:MAG: lipid-A-disaccharide synthase [Geothrix sp.]|uniref:lipid-A-disaccharide synthase n=1 Tax=Geothrix sp. TaxID=1962974 RepID=UPI0018363FC5|nr:lipid-A-disaccharide synthase [Geothrix sp.]NWJ40222.1 lipid-A-disaccharide synthase [Geothrix sp.]WIL21772.1 MAG: lipid-A-disaccharide synthase [Geothrix sp.]